jgi:hypothetical protein
MKGQYGAAVREHARADGDLNPAPDVYLVSQVDFKKLLVMVRLLPYRGI